MRFLVKLLLDPTHYVSQLSEHEELLPGVADV